MTKTRPSVIGQGTELFGRGIDLLFGEADEIPLALPTDLDDQEAPAPKKQPISGSAQPEEDRGAETRLDADGDSHPQVAAEAFEQDATHSSGARPSRSQETTMKHHRNDMKATAGANNADGKSDYLSVSPEILAEPVHTKSEPPASAEPLPLELGGTAPIPLELGGDGPAEPLELEGSTATPGASAADQIELIHTEVDELGNIVLASTPPPHSPPSELEESTMPDQPRPSSNTEAQAVASSTNGSDNRKVGLPGADASGPGGAKANPSDFELSGGLSQEQLEALSKEDIREIMQRLRKGDLAALDKEVDDLYETTSHLLSGSRREATVAFEILRKVRLMLLKDPEQFAQMEYLVRQVRTRVNQIEQSIEAGKRNAPRIFTYEVIWLVFLSSFALVTTVGGTTFSAWVAYLLGVPVDSERLNWAVLFMSTLAWGGIGGVTSALWSLYYHISIQRDYDPVENLWYYSQPVLGMVLGGIVFLIMGAGFLVVQVDLAGQDAALGARLLPAAIAVIAGFRQTVVLDLIERAIALIAPSKSEDSTLPTPPSEPI